MLTFTLRVNTQRYGTNYEREGFWFLEILTHHLSLSNVVRDLFYKGVRSINHFKEILI